MKLVLPSRTELSNRIDRPLNWHFAALALLSLGVAMGIITELLVTGISDAERAFIMSKLKSLSTWTSLALEHAAVLPNIWTVR